jgi:hypothetical protein
VSPLFQGEFDDTKHVACSALGRLFILEAAAHEDCLPDILLQGYTRSNLRRAGEVVDAINAIHARLPDPGQ